MINVFGWRRHIPRFKWSGSILSSACAHPAPLRPQQGGMLHPPRGSAPGHSHQTEEAGLFRPRFCLEWDREAGSVSRCSGSREGVTPPGCVSAPPGTEEFPLGKGGQSQLGLGSVCESLTPSWGI